MNLPKGILHRPRQKELIAKDADAILRIATDDRYPSNVEYAIKNRSFDDAIAPYLHGDWADFDRLFRFARYREVSVGTQVEHSPVIYAGAEHAGDPKLPNLTVVPNFSVLECRGLARPVTVLACTMGHWHTGEPRDRYIQEIYEFQSFGLLVLDREEGQVDIWVAQEGDKVAVPSACHMTLYNLGDADNPLLTVDFADPDRNLSDKKLVGHCGPILLAYYDDHEVTVTLNHLYINSGDHSAGVRLASPPKELPDCQITVPRVGRMDLGALLYERLTQDTVLIGQFARLGLNVRKAGPYAAVELFPPEVGQCLYFSRPLVDAASPGTLLYRRFCSGSRKARLDERGADRSTGKDHTSRLAAGARQALEDKLRTIWSEPVEDPEEALGIVVEGAGDWVTKAYRPLFEELQQNGRKISVIYADDTRWSPSREWTRSLKEWEVYLDKAHPEDFPVYQNLPNPDVVFIVTPDFTHSTIARWWLGRQAPVIFVEKPFDSLLSNVEALLAALGRDRFSAIFGLDHYRFRASQLDRLMPDIEEHLGGSLISAEFYMCETRPLELGREKTLQFGLTLDMLPHFPALLACFGEIESIDDMRIEDAGQYSPLIAERRESDGTLVREDISERFRNETYSKIHFTFEDYSGSHCRVPCRAVVGKGFAREVKYLEVQGRNGNVVRVDFTKKPDPDPVPGYPWESLMLLAPAEAEKGTTEGVIADPHNEGRFFRIVYSAKLEESGKQYQKLLEDVANGTREVLGSALGPAEASDLVRAIDRIWWALQEFKDSNGWSARRLGESDPTGLGRQP
jgi:predicted dehydrogenase